MKRRNFKIIFGILCILLILSIIILFYILRLNGIKDFDVPIKLKVCPDEWYDNQMLGPPSESPTQYFVLNGNRRELSEFDVDWVKENCNLPIQVVV